MSFTDEQTAAIKAAMEQEDQETSQPVENGQVVSQEQVPTETDEYSNWQYISGGVATAETLID
jgi:hypothetical protein